MSEPGVASPAVAPGSSRAPRLSGTEAPALLPADAQVGPAAQAEQAAHAERAAQAAQAAFADRERGLFRHASSAGQVHPLRHLLRRYRAGERA